jgi:hypothetical protein
MSNPYVRAETRARTARLRAGGVGARIAGLLPYAGAFVALPLLADTMYAFARAPSQAAFVDGATGLVGRVGLALAAGLSLTTYAEAVRGADRGVVDLHPLRASDWLTARLIAALYDRGGWLIMAAILLLPIVFPGQGLGWRDGAYGAALIAAAGAWCAGAGAGFGVNLGAPGLADDPRLAGVFDAIRGPNPRLQAALLYAPGVALAVSGSAAIAGAAGAGMVMAGDPVGWFALPVPFVVGALGVAVAYRFAPERARLPALLGEIDAAHAAAESPEEARAVYLEWAVRFVPSSLRRDLHKDLRQLWRAERPWATGSWGLAALTALAGWSASPSAADRMVVVGGASALALGYVGVRLAAGNPAWLDAWLPSGRRAPSRAVAVALLAQPVVLAGAAALAVRQGLPLAAGAALRVEGVVLVCAVLGALSGERLRGRGGIVYVPAGLVAWAIGGAL